MEANLFTRVLVEAVRVEGSEQALASRLRVPASTLSRWLTGRAQTPLRAFEVALDFVMEAERKAAIAAELPAAIAAEPLVFQLGRLAARCERCDGTQFLAADGAGRRLIDTLRCTQCGAEVVHGSLLVQLAKDAVQHARAHAARTRRAAARTHEQIENVKRHLDESDRQDES